MDFEEYLKQQYGINEPIHIEDIKFGSYSRSWIFSELKKMVDAGMLKRFDRGIYYFPRETFYGYASLDPRKVVGKKYISDGSNVYGYIAGLSLLNSAGISTQCPNMLELVSNNESARVRDVTIGFQKVRVRKARTKIDNENVNALMLLDLLSAVNPAQLNETELLMLVKFVRDLGVTQQQIEQYARYYPMKAMKNLVESRAIYELTH